ncbi:hypothetical protein BG015_000143 [Linnemannia schmuckeri]|uniref:Uncharacterized protein n=1 Tax=Linnemannia schmuckeri TaxID=64567 RepID=A0A9P5RRW8_9FUNG|nr:hypothetical protein BG015_000143 [Linnemannia schmuckeri]
MAHEHEHQNPFSDNNVYGAYENDDDDYGNYDNGYDNYDDTDMSSSIMSFGEPDLDEIALQITLVVFHPAMDNDTYDFINDFDDLYMSDVVEAFDEPGLDDVAWQVALAVGNDAPNKIIREDDSQPR